MQKPDRQSSRVSSHCYQCVAGPDLLNIEIEDGVATRVTPNFAAADVHPAGVKALGLIQKTHNPAAAYSDQDKEVAT